MARSRYSPVATNDFSALSMLTLDVEQNPGLPTSLVIDGQDRQSSATTTTSQKIHAVRPEVINALSFLSVVWTLHEDAEASFLKYIFLTTGVIIMSIDLYFIYCAWQLQTHHAIPFIKNSGLHTVGALDDLLSDLPQSIWVFLYAWNFKFSLIAMVCAIHSAFSLVEGMFKLRA